MKIFPMLKRNAALAAWIILSLGGWLLLARVFEGNAAVIGPEFIVRAPIKLFYVVLAAFLTLSCDKWIAPVIAKWCDSDKFREAWENNPNDPRLKLCVLFYLGVFVGLCLVFAL